MPPAVMEHRSVFQYHSAVYTVVHNRGGGEEDWTGDQRREGTQTWMKLPETDPRDDPAGLWALQQELLMRAEFALGPRDASKTIYQPQYTEEEYPHITITPNFDGAFVEVAGRAACSWPEAVFQMAHETVHLLNPITGNTNYVEEGVALAFSLGVQPFYGICVQTSMKSYLYALQLVAMLPGGPLEAGRRVRERVGALSAATVQDLERLFPGVEGSLLSKLVEEFDRDME